MVLTMANPEAGPGKLAAVPTDAYRRTGFLEQWRFWVPLLAVVLIATWRTLDHVWPAVPGPEWHSPGQLAWAHALWDNDCNACHQPFTPASSANWLGRTAGLVQATEAQCKACHAGAEHHQAENASLRPGCTSCHREHQGRDSLLVRVANSHCVGCHQNLQACLAPNAVTTFLDVSGFSEQDHPEFQVLRKKVADPGKLKFNHKRHMMPGMRLTEDGEPFTVGMIQAQFRELYGPGPTLGSPVQLKCTSCHQLDSGDFAAPPASLTTKPVHLVQPARSSGAYMLPIVYEKHCQACHPLTFEGKQAGNPQSGPVAILHRLQPVQLHWLLEAFFFHKHLHNEPSLPKVSAPPLPGKSSRDKSLKTLADIREQVIRAEHELYLGKKTCGECHHWAPAPMELAPDQLRKLHVQPTNLKEVWFEQAVFNHSAHRLLDCRVCHANAYAQDATGRPNPCVSMDNKDVILPGIATCFQCHGPSTTAQGSARHDCVTCHRYHDGDHPLGGRGSAIRAGKNLDKLDITEFLQGRTK
jgi:predicted CXXCH cytochrome family protein